MRDDGSFGVRADGVDVQSGSSYQFVPLGEDAQDIRPGDFLLMHGHSWVARLVGFGEWVRFRFGYWTHAAWCYDSERLIEALPPKVRWTSLDAYRGADYVHVRTGMDERDAVQANRFVVSCVGQRYGFVTDVGIWLRYCMPGDGLWFGLNGTEMCAGLVGQGLCRGWANFEKNPGSLGPTELAIEYGVPARPKAIPLVG